MSLATAMGRWFQIAPNKLKDLTTSELRCDKHGCLLASTVGFDWQGRTHRVVIVHAHTTNKLLKHGQPEGVNATARRERYPGLTAEVLQDMEPKEVLDLLYGGQLTEANLEAAYRESGGHLGRISYMATVEDFKAKHSPNLLAVCNHGSIVLNMEDFNRTKKVTRISLPKRDSSR